MEYPSIRNTGEACIAKGCLVSVSPEDVLLKISTHLSGTFLINHRVMSTLHIGRELPHETAFFSHIPAPSLRTSNPSRWFIDSLHLKDYAVRKQSRVCLEHQNVTSYGDMSSKLIDNRFLNKWDQVRIAVATEVVPAAVTSEALADEAP